MLLKKLNPKNIHLINLRLSRPKPGSYWWGNIWSKLVNPSTKEPQM